MNTSMHWETNDFASDPALAPAGMANLSRLSVLVADGDAAQSQRTLALLGGLEVRDVVCVQDRDSALAWLRSRAFDVLLCASRLGEHDGVELLRQARQVSPATRPVLLRPHSRAAQPSGIEALERPFSAAKLQALLSHAAAPLGGLWCEVPQLSLSDILQMYHQGRRSITVLLSGPIAGRIRLIEGEIVHAECEHLEGLPALSRLLEADSGLLRTEATTPDGPQTVRGPFESTILAAAQILDERRRDRPNTTPPTPAHTLNEPRPGLAPSPSPEFSEEPPSPRSKPRPLIFALASALVLGVVTLVLLLRNSAVEDRELRAAGAQELRSDVRGLASHETSPPAPSRVNPAIAPAPDAVSTPPAVAPQPAVPQPAVPQQAVPQTAQRLVARQSFELTLVSRPSRARVLERGKPIGRTPLTLTLERESVARAPREFTLVQPGHEPHVVRQGDSAENVKLDVALQPLIAVDGDVLDADTFESPRSPAPQRPPPAGVRSGRPGLDIRLSR